MKPQTRELIALAAAILCAGLTLIALYDDAVWGYWIFPAFLAGSILAPWTRGGPR